MAEALTGAFLDIAVVEDYDNEEEETEILLDRTTEDVEIERDPDEIDWQEHNNARMQRREGAESATMTFEMVLTDDQENLQDAGILDEDGAIMRNVIHEAVRIHIFVNEADDEPAATYFAEETQFVYETTNLPLDDVATIEMSGWIHGDHGYE